MPAHVQRRIDPSPAQLLDMLEGAYRRAAHEAFTAAYAPSHATYPGDPPSFDELLAHAAARPQGVYARRTHIDWILGMVNYGACWWTDVVGRRHWVVHAHAGEQRHTIAALAEDHGEGLVEDRHPLEWIAPEVAGGWRSRNGAWDFRVICRCGFAGTPESLAWAGATCGPCFDREQEGLPPAGLPPLRQDVGLLSELHLLPDGHLIAVHASEPHTHDEAPSLHLRVWAAPWTGKPRWGRRWSEFRNLAVSPGGLIAIESTAGRITLVGQSDGHTRDSRELAESANPEMLAFAGKEGERLIVNMASAAGSILRAWTVTASGSMGTPLYLRERRGAHHVSFAVSPRGQRLLLQANRAVEVCDAETGDVIERLAVPPGGRVSALLALKDGSVLAATFMDDRTPPTLHRWRPREETRQPGLFAWLMTPNGRAPDVSRPMNASCEKLTASPDGRYVAGVEDGVVLRDAATLEERGRFRPAQCEVLPSLAFTTDGLMLVATDRGLAVWPWRELFGVAS